MGPVEDDDEISSNGRGRLFVCEEEGCHLAHERKNLGLDYVATEVHKKRGNYEVAGDTFRRNKS